METTKLFIKRTQDLKTVEIDGSQYVKVSERIKFLAENFDYEIDTFVEYIDALNCWKAKAILTLYIDEKEYQYSGNASEEINSNDINKTSALENAETSAVGRACAMAGIGIADEIASVEEVKGAKEQKKEVKVSQRAQNSKKAETDVLKQLTAKAKQNEK